MRSRKGLPAKWGKKIKSPLSPRATTTHQAAAFSRFCSLALSLSSLLSPLFRLKKAAFPPPPLHSLSLSTMHFSSTLRAQRLAAPTVGANARRAAPMVVARASSSANSASVSESEKEKNDSPQPGCCNLYNLCELRNALSGVSSLERGEECNQR